MAQIDDLTEEMMALDEIQLFLRLGMSAKEISEDLEDIHRNASINSLARSISISTRDNELLEFGKRLFKRLNLSSYQLLCKESSDEDKTLKKIAELIEDNTDKAAALLAPVLVAELGLAPAVAAIVAALIIKTVSEAVAGEICDIWKGKLEASESSTT